MGREQKRKYAKKYGKDINKMAPKDDKTFKKYIIVVLAVLLVAFIFYLLSAIFITKEINLGSKKENNETNVQVQNNILAKNTFRQTEEVYYVYYYDFDNKISDIENSIGKLDDKVYRVNTKDALNTNYVSEESNPSAKVLEELKVKAPTLIKVQNDEIISYFEGEDSISAFLNS